MPGIAYRVQVVGALAYVADALSGLRIIDVSNPAAPVERGHYDTPDSASDVWVVGTLAYVADGNSGLRIIDVSDPAAPAELGFYDTPGSAHSVQVAGTLAYVADSSAGLRIIDVSNPAAPVLRGFCSTPNTARRLQVVGTLAYVADAASGLQIFDVSNPAAPIRRGYYSVMNDALDVQVVATVAYVADWSFGLRTIDVSNPSAPVQTGICDTPGGAEGVDVVGSLAYVADASGGLQVIPITTGPIGTAAQNVTQLDSTTFRVQLGAWLAEGTKYNILVGPEIADLSGNMMDQDANGVAGQMPADGFALTVPGGGQALAMPLAPTLPQGLMTYQGQVASSVDCVGDVDSFVMDLPGGQTAAVLVIPSAGLAPTVQMLGPDRASIGSDSASAAGQQAAIPTVSLAASGRYTVSVAGAATTGTYTIRVILNAAAEGEGYAGTDNGWPFLAQDLNGSFMRLDGGTAGPGLGPQRAAVVGSLAATGDSEDWYSFTLAPGEAATLAATGLAASAAKVELYQWSGVAPTWVTVGTSPVLYPLIADMVLPNGSTVSKIAYRTQADRGKLPLGALAKVVLASGKASYGVVTLVDSVHMFVQLDRSLGVNASMPVQASTTTYSAVLLATGAVGAGLADGGADSVVRDFVSAAGGTYYARVTSKTPGSALDYSLLVTRSATLAAPGNNSPASAQDITATGAAFGSTGPAGMGRLFAYDQAAHEICELDPQSGAVLHRLAWQAPVQPSGPAGSPALATTATTLLATVAVPDPAGGEGGYVVYELNPDTGAVLRTVSQGDGSLAAAGAYCDGQVALTAWSVRATAICRTSSSRSSTASPGAAEPSSGPCPWTNPTRARGS